MYDYLDGTLRIKLRVDERLETKFISFWTQEFGLFVIFGYSILTYYSPIDKYTDIL